MARQERDQAKAKLAKAIRPRQRALTILTGDWNFVTDQEDRINLLTGDWPRNTKDTEEHEQWNTGIFSTHGLREAWQGELAHRTTQGAAWLDRT